MYEILRDVSFVFPIVILAGGLIRKTRPLRVLVLFSISLLLAFSGVVVDSLARMDCDKDCIPGIGQASIWFEVMILVLNLYLLVMALRLLKGREAKMFSFLMFFAALGLFVLSVSVSNNS